MNSVPLSLTTVAGLPRVSNRVASSRATLAPDSDVSAIGARHSRVQSSTTVKIRNRRPSTARQAIAKQSAERGQLVRDEVQRPALVRHQRQHHRGPRADRPFAPAPAPHMPHPVRAENHRGAEPDCWQDHQARGHPVPRGRAQSLRGAQRLRADRGYAVADRRSGPADELGRSDPRHRRADADPGAADQILRRPGAEGSACGSSGELPVPR